MSRITSFAARAALVFVLIAVLMSGIVLADSYSAGTMRLLRHEGSVEIFDISGQSRFLLDNVRFASGESILTGEDGQASVGMDDSKIVSLDHSTRVEFVQEADHMQLNLIEGTVFLDVQEKLDENETFDIQTTTMTVGIRGTLVLASHIISPDTGSGNTTIAILEGAGRLDFTDTSGARRMIDLPAGQKVTVSDTAISGSGVTPVISDITLSDLAGFASEIITGDEILAKRVSEGSPNGEKLLLPPSEDLVDDSAGLSDKYPAGGDWTWNDRVTLVAQSASKLYDGKPLFRTSDALVYGLPGEFTIKVSAAGSQTDAGVSDNIISSFTIFNAAGENVTSHFINVEKVSGSLVVDPTPLTVWTGSAEKYYDGEPLVCEEAEIRTVPGHTAADQPWLNTSLITETVSGGEQMIAVSGRIYVHGTNPLTGETQQMELFAGQSLSVCLNGEDEGQSLEFRIENLSELELPEEVLRLYADNPDLLEQACIETGWDPDLMASLIADLPALEDTVSSVTGLLVSSDARDSLMTDSADVRISIDSDITNYGTRSLTEEEAQFTPIVLDPSIVITATGSQTEVGESVNTYEIDWGNADPKNYTFKEDLGTLTVLERIESRVTITAASAEKTYDSTELRNGSFTVHGLPEGYKVQATVTGSVTDAGSAKNEISFWRILNEEGEDASEQFADVQTVSGTLTILPAALTVRTGSDAKVYDGEPLTCTEGELQGLAGGETASVSPTGSLTAAGSATNTCSVIWGTAKQENYTVIEELGTLTVEALSVEISCGGTTATYIGSPFVPSPSLTYTNGTHAGESVNGFRVTGASAASGRKTQYSFRFSLFTKDTVDLTLSGAGTAAGSYTLTGTAVSGSDSVSCGNITGTALTIEPAVLTITTGSAEKPYDGAPLTCEEISADGLQGSDRITVRATGSQTDVGESPNTYTIDWSGTDSSCYTITENLGTLKVTEAENEETPAPEPTETPTPTPEPTPVPGISFTAPSAEKAYDGTPLTAEDVSVSGLPDGFSFTAEVTGSQTDVGESENVVSAYAVFSADGGDVTSSFTDVTLVPGRLTVTANTAQITVLSVSDNMVYSGLAFMNNGYDVSGLPSGFELVAEVTGLQTDAGESANTIASYAIIKDGSDVTSFFTGVTVAEGILTVTPAALSVSTEDKNKIYDGTPLTADEPVVVGMADGETVSVSVNEGSITDAGEITPSFVIDWGTAKESNYTVTMNLGKLTVEPASLSISTEEQSKVFDGTPLLAGDPVINGLADSEAIEVAVNGSSITDVGELTPSFIISWGTTKETNYTVTMNPGKLTVTPLALDFDLGGRTYDYGEGIEIVPSLSCGGTSIAAELTEAGDNAFEAFFSLPTGDTATLLIDGCPWGGENVGTYPLSVSLNISGNESNYIVSYSNTSVTIQRAKLTVSTESETKIYDGSSGPLNTTASVIGDPFGSVRAYATGAESADVGTYDNQCEIEWNYEDENNFDVTYDLGKLTIEKRPVVMTSESKTVQGYSGEEVRAATVIVSGDGFAEGEGADFDVTGVQQGQGSSANTFTYTLWTNTKDKNYDITTVYGTLTLELVTTPEINASSAEKTYDGTPLTAGYTYEYFDDDYEVSAVVSGSQTNVGESSNTISTYTIFKGGVNVTDTFQAGSNVLIHDGLLKVIALPLTFDLGGGTMTEAEYTLSPSMTRGDTEAVVVSPSSVSFSDDGQPGTRTCTAVFPLVGNETVTVIISGIPTGESESDSYQLSSVFTFSGLESNYTYTLTNNVITKE